MAENRNADDKPAATDAARRPIRSFVRREGRLTPSQKRALVELWPQYGIDFAHGLLDLDQEFHRDAPGRRVLEIGFGNGAVLAQLAVSRPGDDFLGIEVHRPGVGHLLQLLKETECNNVRIIRDDAVEVLKEMLPPESLDEVLLFFPDPWPKKRHHKRRIVQPAFIELVASKLKPGGVFHLATDWQNYAEQMLELIDNASAFENVAGAGKYSERPASRPETKFERRGLRLGHEVWDLLYRKR
ncbi:MAG: tRNA (guanosine(46)-N7)-methyltransferase TrmB [Gammaproteobacteria bacterium]|nr:tRNA (guanosine(46)-N7)-methyltransferase TrmB [Gammaproteobacteria bacterium]